MERLFGYGIVSAVNFQCAKVQKPLLAVSNVADKGNSSWFDKEECRSACIIPGDSPELPEIRRLIAQIRNRVRLERTSGIYLLRNWLLRNADPDAGFPRQGQHPQAQQHQ